jgi:hypothetical protein
MTAPSIIFLPGRKAVWIGLIILWETLANLLVVTFVKILKETFNKQIDLYYCGITFASFLLGNKIMVPKFKLCRGNVP